MKRTIYFLTFISAIMLLTACVKSLPYWYKQGVSKEDTYSYYQSCAYNIGINKVSEKKERALMKACMEKSGFRWVRK